MSRGRWPVTRPCGTAAAYRRHLRHGEPACDACLEAVRLTARRATGYPRPRPDLQPCGTVAAYRRHLRHGEPACPACLGAIRVAGAEARDRRRGDRPARTLDQPRDLYGRFTKAA